MERCVAFDRIATTTKTESKRLVVLGNPTTKSMEASINSLFGIGKGV